MASTSKESYGTASYAISRHRKNKVFMWQSRVVHGRVYEFLVASKFKVPGLVSWKCMHCMQVREKLKRERKPVKHLKIPLVLIDNDVIRENPDEPLNAPHFCKGKDVVDAVLKRTKLQFYEEWSFNTAPIEVSVDRFSDAVLEAVPLDLDALQKRQMKQSLDEKCERVMKKVLRKRKREAQNEWQGTSSRIVRTVDEVEDCNRLPKVVVSSALSTLDENEYIDVVGDTQDSNRSSLKDGLF